MEFAQPYALALAALALPLAGLVLWRRRRGLALPTTSGLAGVPPTFRLRLARLLPVTRLAAVVLLAVALAGPRVGDADAVVPAEGIDIALTVDISSSMESGQLGDQTRLEAVKDVVREFVRGREDDRIGLVVFQEEALALTPPTLDYESLDAALADLESGLLEDGTGIGAGLATSVNMLRESTAASRIIVLLTDGEQNAASISPEEAAQLASALRIRVYTIGVVNNVASPDVDEELLTAIAERTGARFYAVDSADRLGEVYEEIGALETSSLTRDRFERFTQLAPWFLLPAAALLGLELILRGQLAAKGAAVTFTYPWVLALVVVVVAAYVLWVLGMARGRQRVRALSRDALARPRYVAAGLLAVAGVLAIVAAAGPRWGTQDSLIPRTGAQLVVVLDTSRSMAVADVAPTRLAAAKAGLVATFDRLGGDRVGLVIFAGDARVRFPLTTDLNAASRVVESIEIGQVLVAPGSSAASGLDLGLDAFDEGQEAGRLLVLITDGDDLGTDPAAVAERIRSSGVNLIVVGAGTAEGGQVPAYDADTGEVGPHLDATGQPVVSALNEDFLRALALAAGGQYLGSDLSAIAGAVDGRIATLERSTIARETASVPIERFQWFVAGALVALVLGSVTERLPRPGRRAAGAAFAVSAALLAVSCATRAHELNEDGRDLFRDGDYEGAAAAFLEAQSERPDDPEISLNLATALHAAGQLNEASVAARRALDSASAAVRARAHASLGHHRFAAGDLPGALDSFRESLIEDPGQDTTRRDYEVVLRLLTPAPDPTEPAEPPLPGQESPTPGAEGTAPPAGEATPTPGDGGGPGAGGSPTPGASPSADGPPQPGASPGDATGGRPETPQEAQAAVSALDEEIARLVEEAGEDPTAAQAAEILDLVAERSRLAAIRDAFGEGSNPNDY